MSRSRTPSRDVERALVDAAERVLVRDGLGGLSVRAVATEAKVAPMGVYNHLGGKEALVAAVLLRGFEGLRAAVADVGDEPDPVRRLNLAGLGYRRFALSHPEHYRAMFETPALESWEPGTPLEAAAKAAFDGLVGHVGAVLAAHGGPVAAAPELAQQIWSAVHGAVSLELKGLVKTPDPAATYAAMLTLIERGLRTTR